MNSDVVDGKIKEGAPHAQLYDLSSDPYQEINLYDQEPAMVKELEDILKSWRNKAGPYPELGWIANRQK